MKKSRFSEEQIIGFPRQVEAGMPIKELCRNGGFSDATLKGLPVEVMCVDARHAKALRISQGFHGCHFVWRSALRGGNASRLSSPVIG